MGSNILNIKEPVKNTESGQANVSKIERLYQHPILDLPFRSYFLLAPAFSIISLGLWLAFLNGVLNFDTRGLTPSIWHLHEMIFAFGATVAVAFILTAAQTWTNQRSVHGKALALLIILWLVTRLALLINSEISIYAGIVLQATWWLAVISLYAKLVFKANNRRNYVFIPMMVLMASLNIAILVADILGNTGLALHLSRSMILVFVLLMSVVGGRVIPFFTIKGANTSMKNVPKWLNNSLIWVSIIGLIMFMLSHFVDLAIKPAVFMIAASILHCIRLLHWRTLQTLSVPLLWSLHTAYGFISLGLLMLGLSYYQIGISFSDSLHLITIGAISLMILSMMSRVSLGHTGRALVVKKMVSLAFIIMLIATFIRSFLPYLLKSTSLIVSWNLSAALWISAMLIFLITYWPILTTHKK